jgi:twin BRCT domain
MFQAVNRKRALQSSIEEVVEPSRRPSSAMPLHGVLVCLSGLPADYKVKLHQLVKELGGGFTRDLDTSKTTHLIANAPDGDKYSTAKTYPRIHVVSPDWIEQTAKSGVRAREESYLITVENVTADRTLEEGLDQILKSDARSKLFASCKFYSIGFPDESNELLKLSKLIRRGMGTNYWELNEVITHIIVQDECENVLREAAQTVTLHHPNGPAYVSPRWVVASWNEQQLQPPHRFEPRQKIEIIKSANPTKVNSHRVSTGLFRGTIFCIIRIAPPEGCIDWNSDDLESTIAHHGGQMLSSKLLEALRSDQSKHDAVRRTLYIVCWGGYTPLHATLNPNLAHIKKEDLCSIVPVTPIWLNTAVAEQKMVIPNRRPLLFQPQSWPFSALSKSTKIALTGFAGSERTGLMQLIETLGATYTANLKPNNTHLICKEANGPKYDKAMEWNLHVVTVEWLHHVARYGLVESDGVIENKFRLRVDAGITTIKKTSAVDKPCMKDDRTILFPSEVGETQGLPSQDS